MKARGLQEEASDGDTRERAAALTGALRERVDNVMQQDVQNFAVDVRGCLDQYHEEEAAAGQCSVGQTRSWSMGHFVANLLENNELNLQRQQEACLKQLVNGCLLPFYSCLDQLGKLRGLKKDSRLRMPDVPVLLQGEGSAGVLYSINVGLGAKTEELPRRIPVKKEILQAKVSGSCETTFRSTLPGQH